MEYFFFVTLLTTSFISWIILRFLLRKQKKPTSIEASVDPSTGRKRVRIFEGDFEKGIHDDVYVFGQAILTNVIFIESLVPLEKSLIIKALVSLANVHPLLRMKCEWEPLAHTGKLQRFLTEMKQFVVENLQYFEENEESFDEWPQRFEEELLQGFDTANGPLWRVVRLKESFDSCRNIYINKLLFSFHHSISDEVSILNFFDQLLDIMDQIYCKEFSSDDLQPLPLLPTLKDLVSHHTELPWWKVGFLKLNTKLQSFRAPEYKFLKLFPPPLPSNPNMKLKTCILPGSLTKSQTALLLKNCKNHSCTVTGALGASIATAIGKLVAKVTNSPTEFTIGMPVNIRKGCKPVVNSNHFGLYIGLVFHSFTVGSWPFDDHFWRQAKQFSDDTKQKICNNEQYNLSRLFRYNCIDLVKEFENSKGNITNTGRYDNFELSNGGYYDFDKNRVFKITQAHFAVSQEIMGPMLTLSAITTCGRLNWSVLYSNGTIHKENADELSQLFMESLIGIGCQAE